MLTAMLVLRLVLVLQSGTCFSCVNSDACFGTGPDPLHCGTCFFVCVNSGACFDASGGDVRRDS